MLTSNRQSLLRRLYSTLFYVAVPVALLRLYWRGSKSPAYRLRWRERLGYYQIPQQSAVIWLHAVSVGEAEAAFILIKALKQRFPQQSLLLTTTTPTGSARVKAVLGDSVQHVYLPYDTPTALARFFAHFSPQLAVFLEKEIWPNLYAECASRGIPLLMVNARLSARSAKAYEKISGLIKPALACVRKISVQTQADAAEFLKIGASEAQLVVSGNIKFDLQLDQQTLEAGKNLKQNLFAGRFVCVLASTHAHEEALLLEQLLPLQTQIPELLLVIVPRHPERFNEVAQLVQGLNYAVMLRSSNPVSLEGCLVYLADSMGELKQLYAAADLAFVGGSLVAVGGHNVLEAVAAGVPVLFGPHMFNFQEIANGMLLDNAAWQCQDAKAVADAILAWRSKPQLRSDLAQRGQQFLQQNRGAVDRVTDLLTTYLQV